MRFTNSIITSTMLVLFSSVAATAQVDVSLDNVDNSSQLTGYVTQDLKVDTQGDWFGAALVLELESGTIYQDGFGNDVEPGSFLLAYYPSVAFDTYMTGGGQWGIGVLGAGGDAGGYDQQFDAQRLDASWKSNSTGEVGVTPIARITLSDDAAGRWRLVVFQSGDETRYDFTGTIADGVMTIEP